MAEVDVCVIGSGAGGSPVALALARAGMRVVVLEKGPRRDRSQFVHDELTMVRRDFFVPFAGDDPHYFRPAADAPERATSFGWISRGVGGGTVHFAGYAHRLHPHDMRRATRSGGLAGTTIADWPIGYHELEPYYAIAEREIGVSGLAAQGPGEPPRSAPYPHPPLPCHPIAARVEAGAALHGARATTTPRAILSEPESDRSSCVFCRLCSGYGCEVGAKGSTLETLLPRAERTGRCTIVPGTSVRELRVDARGRVIAAIHSDERGAEHEQRAALFVVACSAIESARLLLNSRSARFPDGLANGSGLVGRNLMLLAMGRASARFAPGGRSGLETTAPGLFVNRTVREPGGAISFELSGQGPIQVAERLSIGPDGAAIWGRRLKDRIRAFASSGLTLQAECFSECLPRADNRVDVGGPADPSGVPAARITFRHHPRDGERNAALTSRAMRILEAAGADAVDPPEPGGTFDVIQSGTARFGLDPRTSVLDPDCRAHEVSNLYVTDGSFLPTSGSVPLTLTILANAFRVADSIRARAARGDPLR